MKGRTSGECKVSIRIADYPVILHKPEFSIHEPAPGVKYYKLANKRFISESKILQTAENVK